MNELDVIALESSVSIIAACPGVTVLDTWQRFGKQNIWMLRLCLELIQAEPTEYVPKQTEWLLITDFEVDTWGKTLLYPASENGLEATFPHQMFNGAQHLSLPCKHGHLCTSSGFDNLAANRNALPTEPQNTVDRLVWHVRRGIEWLTLAAKGALTPNGSFFELPDFTFGIAAHNAMLAYNEDANSFKEWQSCSQESGIVELAALYGKTFFATLRFLDTKRTSLYEPSWGTEILEQSIVIPALWIRLASLPVVNNWQAPSTIEELQKAISIQGKDLNQLLNPLWNRLPTSGEALLLIGAPVPVKVGEANARYHWQALRLAPPTFNNSPSNVRIGLIKNQMKILKRPIPWIAKAENWNPEALQSRGQLDNTLQNSNVVLFGAGSLGSCLAEQMVRMGLQKLTIVDSDSFEAGNLVRHSLTLQDLSQSKSIVLAQHLNQCNPSAHITGIGAKSTDVKSNTALQKAIQDATIIIDATADDDLLKSMPFKDIKAGGLFISCSLSLYAEHLFLYATQAEKFNWDDFNEWFAPFRAEQDKLAQEIELPRNAGCWHPLTPARLNRIQGLSGIAIEVIEQITGDHAKVPTQIRIDWQKITL